MLDEPGIKAENPDLTPEDHGIGITYLAGVSSAMVDIWQDRPPDRLTGSTA